MLLSIDESKVAELLKSSVQIYKVSGVSILVENRSPERTTYPANTAVSGTVGYNTPLLITRETKQHFMSLRDKIEKSGDPLESPEQLTREVDEMRGRR